MVKKTTQEAKVFMTEAIGAFPMLMYQKEKQEEFWILVGILSKQTNSEQSTSGKLYNKIKTQLLPKDKDVVKPSRYDVLAMWCMRRASPFNLSDSWLKVIHNHDWIDLYRWSEDMEADAHDTYLAQKALMRPSSSAVFSLSEEDQKFYKYIQTLTVSRVTNDKIILKFRGGCPSTAVDASNSGVPAPKETTTSNTPTTADKQNKVQSSSVTPTTSDKRDEGRAFSGVLNAAEKDKEKAQGVSGAPNTAEKEKEKSQVTSDVLTPASPASPTKKRRNSNVDIDDREPKKICNHENASTSDASAPDIHVMNQKLDFLLGMVGMVLKKDEDKIKGQNSSNTLGKDKSTASTSEGSGGDETANNSLEAYQSTVNSGGGAGGHGITSEFLSEGQSMGNLSEGSGGHETTGTWLVVDRSTKNMSEGAGGTTSDYEQPSRRGPENGQHW